MGFNTFSKRPRSVAEYTMMRGVTDFTNAAQFNAYVSGYQYLVVVSVPEYLKKLGDNNEEVKKLLDLFCYILEYEFRKNSVSLFKQITQGPTICPRRGARCPPGRPLATWSR